MIFAPREDDAVLIGIAQHRFVKILFAAQPRLHRVDELILLHLRKAAEEEDVAVVLAVLVDDRRRLADARQHRRHREQRRQEGKGREARQRRSEEHTSELQSLMRISYAVFCLKKKIKMTTQTLEYNG